MAVDGMPVIERAEEFYVGVGGPFYAVHRNGSVYAILSGANDALAYWRGLDSTGRAYIHIENAKGELVRLGQATPGHAYAIIDALRRADA